MQALPYVALLIGMLFFIYAIIGMQVTLLLSYTEVDARCDTLATVVADLSTDSRTVNRGAINRGHTIAFIVIELSELLVVSLLLIALPHSI